MTPSVEEISEKIVDLWHWEKFEEKIPSRTFIEGAMWGELKDAIAKALQAERARCERYESALMEIAYPNPNRDVVVWNYATEIARTALNTKEKEA